MKDFPATSPYGTVTFPATGTRPGAAAYPTPARVYDVCMWGDSLTFGTGGTAPLAQMTLTNLHRRHNRGVGGETSTQILARFAAEPARYSDVTIIWAGRNDNTSPNTVKANIAAMVAALLGTPTYLVLSILNTSSETSGGADHTRITTLNSDLETAYPANFFDIREYLITQGNGGSDNPDVANDVVPASLRSDSIHLNTAGYLKVAQRIEAFMTSKGW